jgi:predicted phospho-2-dehydro-3-deoxyheptonate aldolase
MNKNERLQKIINSRDGKTVIVPMDHGVSDGPIKGIEAMSEMLARIKEGGADAVVVHKGIVKQNREVLNDFPYLIHISASTSLGVVLRKVIVADVAECKELGASGVSVHINLGNSYEPEMLADLGRIARDCDRHEMPLLAMMYVRSEKNGEVVNDANVKSLAHAARIAYELGADIVKVSYPGKREGFQEIVRGCKIPVVLAGGSKGLKADFMKILEDAIEGGASGVSCGRNVFQADDVESMVREVARKVHSYQQ